MATLFRVVNQGLIARSLLLDKIDLSTGTVSNAPAPYAQIAKQQVYVPLHNPLDTSVKGYTDLVPTDEVLLSMNGKGTIAELVLLGYVSVTAYNSSLIAPPTVIGAVHNSGSGSTNLVITGTNLASFSPDVTYVTVTTSGVSQTVSQATILGASGIIGATSITVPNSVFTITPTAGSLVKVQANVQKTNIFTAT